MNPYEVLGIGRDADASKIKQAYRQAAKNWHPDGNASAEAASRFAEVIDAYRLLNDPARLAAWRAAESEAFLRYMWDEDADLPFGNAGPSPFDNAEPTPFDIDLPSPFDLDTEPDLPF